MDLRSKRGWMRGLNNRLEQIKEYKKKNSEEKRKRLMQVNFHSFHITTKYHRLIKEADSYAKKLLSLSQ